MHSRVIRTQIFRISILNLRLKLHDFIPGHHELIPLFLNIDILFVGNICSSNLFLCIPGRHFFLLLRTCHVVHIPSFRTTCHHVCWEFSCMEWCWNGESQYLIAKMPWFEKMHEIDVNVGLVNYLWKIIWNRFHILLVVVLIFNSIHKSWKDNIVQHHTRHYTCRINTIVYVQQIKPSAKIRTRLLW